MEDIDADLTPVLGRLGLAQSVGRRLISPTGSLFYDSDYGDDVRRYLNSPSPATARKAGASAENEAEKDERVERADAAATLAGDDLSIDVRLVDGEGPFELTLNVSDLTVELLTEPGEV